MFYGKNKDIEKNKKKREWIKNFVSNLDFQLN